MISQYEDRQIFIIKAFGLATLYALFGYIGFTLAAPPEYSMLIWPPAGIALGALLICGQRHWVGIALGATIFNISHLSIVSNGELSFSIISSAIGISAGSTLQAVLGYQFIRKYIGVPLRITKVSQAFFLFILGGPIACVVAPSIGVIILYFLNFVQSKDIIANWTVWWVGDIFGIFVFTPIMLLLPVGQGRNLFKEGINKAFPSLVIFALILPLGLTFYAWKISSKYIYEKNKAYFEITAREAQLSLVNRLGSYRQTLAASSSYLMEKNFLKRDNWKAYVDSLRLNEYNPGINGLGIIFDVPSSKINEFSLSQQKEMPNFSVRPDGKWENNFIITYLEPLEKNRPAIGYNIASEDRRYQAAINARDTGNTTLTKKINLVQDNSRRAGFLILHPIYKKPIADLDDIQQRRSNFLGWIYAPFIGKDFMGSLSLLQSHALDLKAYDGLSDDDNSDNLIFSTLHNGHEAAHIALFSVKMPIHILEQSWTLVWFSTPEFEESVDSNEPEIILISGLIVSFLLALVLWALSKRTENIELLVAEKTQELSASEEKFRDAMEFASIGKALVGLDGRFLKVNESLCEFLGYSEEELMSLDFQKLTHPEDIFADLRNIQVLLSGEKKAYQMEKRYIHKQGHNLWAILSVSLVRDQHGTPKYFVSEINDITQKRELDRIKDEFISITSHELRTPITSVNMALNLLSKSLPSGLPDEVSKFVDMASRNSRRLILLINDILDLKKISAGMMEYQIKTENLSSLLREVIEENANYGVKYDVTFNFTPLPEDVFIRVDSKRLVQVISNLLSNAAKFSHKGGKVEIYLKRNNGKIRAFFEDDGVGIPLDFHSRIFQKFSQADTSMTRKEEGTGLGLFICKEMVEKMDGSIGFVSKEGIGSTFWFEFDENEAD